MFNAKGQIAIEAAVIFTIVVACLLAMNGVLKAGIMGNWFNSVQQLGAPYNPPETTGTITNTLVSTSITHVNTISDGDSVYSLRIDSGNSVDEKSGTLTVKP